MKNNTKHLRFFLIQAMNVALIALVAFSCEKEADKPLGNNKVVIATTTVDNIGYYSVNISSSITQTGGNTITDHGFCYATSPNPDINAGKKSLGKKGNPGPFNAELTGLNDNTKYYIRAYAIIAEGTLYAEQKEIFTLKTGKPEVKTDSVFSINTITALFRGIVISDSGLVVIARGACWNTTSNPLVTDSHTSDDDGTGTFLSTITGLSPGVTYHVRAYATNDKGTTYGNTLIFNAKVDLPEVSTTPVSSVTPTTAMSGGAILSNGGASITSKGVCWNTSPNPTILNYLTVDGNGTGTFISNLTSLTPGTTYFVRAYAINSAGTAYGNSHTFTALATLPIITTSAITNITSTTATGGGNVVFEGGADVTARGVCWSTSTDPTISDLHTSNGSGTGSFTSSLTGLTPGSTYYVRAYATNSQGTSYGNQVNFTAGAILPSVTTTAAITITQTTATSGGSVTSDGGANVTARGVCWSTSSNPTIANIHTTDDSGTGTFTSSLTGLTANTHYHIRAYATNSIGTSYGSDRTFTTLTNPVPPTVTTTAANNIAQTTASSGGNVTSSGGATVTARGVCLSTSSNPTIANIHTIDGSGTGTFTSSLVGLTANTLYHTRAYATNSIGTSYGSDRTFTTLANPVPPTVTTTAATNITQTTATSGGNVTSDGGANVTSRGVCWSTFTNPTIADSHTNNGSGAGTFTSELTGLTVNTQYYIKAYAINSLGTAYGDLKSFMTTDCPEFTLTHIAGTTAPVDKTVNYHTVRTNLTGNSKCWITQNLGANHQAYAATDATEASAGWYWQFNRKQGFKHDGTSRTPNTTWITSINENSDWLPANDPCSLLLGSGWRLPTETEWETADATGGWDNYNETFASVLKLHAAGELGYSDGLLWGRGNYGICWSSSQQNSGDGHYLSIRYNTCYMSDIIKAVGLSVRCLRD